MTPLMTLNYFDKQFYFQYYDRFPLFHTDFLVLLVAQQIYVECVTFHENHMNKMMQMMMGLVMMTNMSFYDWYVHHPHRLKAR